MDSEWWKTRGKSPELTDLDRQAYSPQALSGPDLDDLIFTLPGFPRNRFLAKPGGRGGVLDLEPEHAPKHTLAPSSTSGFWRLG